MSEPFMVKPGQAYKIYRAENGDYILELDDGRKKNLGKGKIASEGVEKLTIGPFWTVEGK